MNDPIDVKPVAHERRRSHRHKYAFWSGTALGLLGLTMALGADLTTYGLSTEHMSPSAAGTWGMNHSEALGIAMVVAAFVMFGIAWHLAGERVGVDSH